MLATIKKWGNSNALRIPGSFLVSLDLKENDDVELTQDGDAILIRKAAQKKHKTLEERLVSFYGKPLDKIERIDNEEIDWGAPKGGEAW